MAEGTIESNVGARSGVAATGGRKLHFALWAVQWLLALLFLFAGVMKLVLPLDQMQGPISMPGWFLRFIGVVEVAGGLGLILPSLLRIQPRLTVLAAMGLVIVMIGAAGLTIAGGMIGAAVIPIIVGLFAAFIAYGRARLAVIR